MIEETTEFSGLIDRVHHGDQAAAWELLEKYGSHLRRHVRRVLNKEMRSKFDSIDFVQIVWASFFREPDKLRRLSTPAELMAYLATLARNKVVTEVRRGMGTQKRNIRRELRLQDVHEDERPDLTSREPTPSAVAIFRERWNRLVDDQPKQVREIVEMRFQGSTYHEIAEQLQIHERTARKAIEKLEDETADWAHEVVADAVGGTGQ